MVDINKNLHHDWEKWHTSTQILGPFTGSGADTDDVLITLTDLYKGYYLSMYVTGTGTTPQIKIQFTNDGTTWVDGGPRIVDTGDVTAAPYISQAAIDADGSLYITETPIGNYGIRLVQVTATPATSTVSAMLY